MVSNKNELISLIMRRDDVPYNVAANIVEDCQREIDDVLMHGGSLDTIEEVLKDYLGLELDYFDLFI